MNKVKELVTNQWKICLAQNSVVNNDGFNPTSIEQIEKSNYQIIKAQVPSCLEKALFDNGIVGDPYFSDNMFSLRKYEYYHHWWYTTFDSSNKLADITFEGIDTVADIYVNGEFIGHVEDMFVANTFTLQNLNKTGNELIVHIFPAVLESRKYPLTAYNFALRYNTSMLQLRKEANSFGWDIFPRLICGGIWREIYLTEHKEEKLIETYLTTNELEGKNAFVSLFYRFNANEDENERYQVEVEGKCGESTFYSKISCWHTDSVIPFQIENVKLWWPKGYGQQNLYNVTVNLYKDGVIIDSVNFRYGVRMVGLDKSSYVCEGGKFDVLVNNKKIFIIGTNWVPTDALHTDDVLHMNKGLEMVDDLNFNMLRVWGGGVFERDEFYDFCDEKGILIWQDFMLGCGVYPENDRMFNLIKNEATQIIKRLRQHPSIAIWAGDNECDLAINWAGGKREPYHNQISRNVLETAVRLNDSWRPYIPSSPCVDENGFKHFDELAEDHLWGARRYFKDDYYVNAKAYFASEMGYYGYNSPKSLEKFLKEPKKIFNDDGTKRAEFLAHATCIENKQDALYAPRIDMIVNQVKVLFGSIPQEQADFCRASQISQAEALKYYIERFRVRRNTHGGIIWWNLLDGWPQLSDAVVDFYFYKKIAYHYIKRSQQSLCLMMDEQNGKLVFYGVNDLLQDKKITYKVVDLYTGKTFAQGQCLLKHEYSTVIKKFNVKNGEKMFLYIEWQTSDCEQGNNHFHTNVLDISYANYIDAMNKVNYNVWDGFYD